MDNFKDLIKKKRKARSKDKVKLDTLCIKTRKHKDHEKDIINFVNLKPSFSKEKKGLYFDNIVKNKGLFE